MQKNAPFDMPCRPWCYFLGNYLCNTFVTGVCKLRHSLFRLFISEYSGINSLCVLHCGCLFLVRELKL